MLSTTVSPSSAPVCVRTCLPQDPENPAWSQYSIEFCGGTHLTNTKEAEAFSLMEESGIANVSTLKTGTQSTSCGETRQRPYEFSKHLMNLISYVPSGMCVIRVCGGSRP